MNRKFICREVKTEFCRKILMQIGSSGILIGWESGQTTFVPLWDRMEGAWLWTLNWPKIHFLFYMESCLCLLFRNNLYVQLELERDRFRVMSLSSLRRNLFVQHLHIIYSKRKSVFGWIFILVSIFFSERIFLFSNRHLQPSYSMIKSVLGDFFFLFLFS